MSTWDDQPNNPEHALEIERTRLAMQTRVEREKYMAGYVAGLLAGHKAAIEECARVVKAQHRLGDSVNVGLALDRAEAAIRALKDKQP